MPTTRPRHTVTESETLKGALDDAAKRWPGEPRARLLVLLAEEGHRALQDRVAARREAIRRTSGAFTGMYPKDYLKRLREEWPE